MPPPPLFFSIQTKGGKQKLNCANTESIFRIIQSISSPKAEPFKRWLARVGYEQVQEIEDPELATKRTRALYKAKGYSDTWIEKRMRGIDVHTTLTDEWKKHGVKEGQEYAILTAGNVTIKEKVENYYNENASILLVKKVIDKLEENNYQWDNDNIIQRTKLLGEQIYRTTKKLV